MQALKARKKMRKARKLAEQALPESELSAPQITLLLDLNSGVLEQDVLAKNTAYGLQGLF
jgi:hypothetical protein